MGISGGRGVGLGCGSGPGERCYVAGVIPGTISGYEIAVVALALVALALLVGSALVGVLTRLVRGRVEAEAPRRRWRRSPGAPR